MHPYHDENDTENVEDRILARTHLSRTFLGKDPVIGRIYGPYRKGSDEGVTSWLWSVCPTIPILGIGLSLTLFHAYCSIRGSIPLWEQSVQNIFNPVGWPTLGGESPEWVMEIPTELWLTAMLLIAFMRYFRTGSRWLTELHRPTFRAVWLKQNFYVRLQIMRDAIQVWHRSTRTMIFPAPFCDYTRLGFPNNCLHSSSEDTVTNFFSELSTRVREVDAKWIFALHWDLLLIVSAIVCLGTTLGSALGFIARFCEGFNLKANGYCQVYPPGVYEIRLGHYREWFVNTIVFGLTFFILYSRVRVEKRAKAYYLACQTMMESSFAKDLTRTQREGIQQLLQFEVDNMMKSLLTYHDVSQYQVSGDRDHRETYERIVTPFRSSLRQEITYWMIVKPVLVAAFLIAAPLGFVSYLLIQGLQAEGPEVREKFEEGFYLNHTVGEVAEWIFLFASNVFFVVFMLPVWVRGKVTRAAMKKLLQKPVLLRSWSSCDTKHTLGDDKSNTTSTCTALRDVLQHSYIRIFGCSPIVALVDITKVLKQDDGEELCYPTLDPGYNAYVQFMENSTEVRGWTSTLRLWCRSPSLHVINMILAALISAAAGIISGYGGAMDLAKEFYDKNLQGEAGEYFWNCLVFGYTTVVLFLEAYSYHEMMYRRRQLQNAYAHHVAKDVSFLAAIEDDLESRRQTFLFPPPQYRWSILRTPAMLHSVSTE